MNHAPESVRFCATSRSGLGHLRRITNIARALAHCAGDRPLELITNGQPAGLSDTERSWYSATHITQRAEMAAHLTSGSGPVVVDTAVVPELARIDAPLCLILRESKKNTLSRFVLDGGRPWDLIVLPNPRGFWNFNSSALPARRVAAVGWIYRRRPGNRQPPVRKDSLTLLIASGGGGSGSAWEGFRTYLRGAIATLRNEIGTTLKVVQVMGPRARSDARVSGVDKFVSPGAALPELFATADAVVSTAGYNSTLELALTDTPVLLVPIATTYDDQRRRARYWGARLGRCHEASRNDSSTEWLCKTLQRRERRPPLDLGPSGETGAAQLIMELTT